MRKNVRQVKQFVQSVVNKKLNLCIVEKSVWHRFFGWLCDGVSKQTKIRPMRSFLRILPQSGLLQVRVSIFLFLILAGPSLSAQCDRVGKVVSVFPGCGVILVDVNDGSVLRAVVGADTLSGGQYYSFKAETVALPNGCVSDNLPVVGLTCVSSVLPCTAVFTHAINNAGVFQVDFNAASIGGGVAQTYFWEFGDGTTATTKDPKHNFPKAGNYAVCLTVSDASGCSDQLCKTISVNSLNLNCGYTPKLTAIGLQMTGTLEADDATSLPLASVQWYSNKGTKKLSESQNFKTTLPEYGTYKVCVNYEVGNVQEGTFCASSACIDLVVAETNDCYLSAMADLSSICVPLNVPVCGCNGESYDSECEAMGAGLVSWWAGDCATVFANNCTADMAVEIIQGDFTNGYTAQFRNLASGDYAFEQLDFGDGTPFVTVTQWDTITHVYTKAGIYRTNLSVWQNENSVSSITKIVVTDAASMDPEQLPDGTDYVMPGDANGDKSANVYDLLNIGVAYYTDGIPRPHASTTWKPQFGPNWEKHINAVNYKHVDCDGNGSVDDFDAGIILEHYAPLDTISVPYKASAPKLRVTFEQDTITIDPAAPPSVLEITANIEIGTAVQPALGLYGLAFTMQYPEFVNHDPDIFYSSDYFGSLINILPITKDIYSRRQIDMGLVRKNKIAANGYGMIGKMTLRSDYIIIIDIADRSGGDNKVPLVIPITGIRGIDANGNIKEISVPLQLDTVWIKILEPAVKTHNQAALDAQLQLYPNPATDQSALYTGNLEVESIEVLNTLGQKISSISPTQHLTRIDTQTMQNGVYTLRVHTPQGIAEKRLVKQ